MTEQGAEEKYKGVTWQGRRSSKKQEERSRISSAYIQVFPQYIQLLLKLTRSSALLFLPSFLLWQETSQLCFIPLDGSGQIPLSQPILVLMYSDYMYTRICSVPSYLFTEAQGTIGAVCRSSCKSETEWNNILDTEEILIPSLQCTKAVSYYPIIFSLLLTCCLHYN